jgi:hypothetical protein
MSVCETLAVTDFRFAMLYLADIYRRLEEGTASNLRICGSRILLANAGLSYQLTQPHIT